MTDRLTHDIFVIIIQELHVPPWLFTWAMRAARRIVERVGGGML
ncbi:MAG: hypothetical protein PHY29_02840 [Syntrophales bacterium]|nr:hypothetical protein [Syntrophales bacterium]